MEVAAGSLPEPLALVVAAHVALCTSCRAEAADDEALGGALLERLAPHPLDPGARDRVMRRLDDGIEAPRRGPVEDDFVLPRPVLACLPADATALPWKTFPGGIKEVELRTIVPAIKARLVRIRAGRALPRHAHEGTELVCVLAGGYADAFGHYRRGDFSALGPEAEHRPVADPGEDCLCVVATDAPLRFTGRFGRLLNLFVSC